MKKVLLKAVLGVSLLAIPSSLWATNPIVHFQGPTIQPTAVETCVGATEPSGLTVITFVNHTSNTVTITCRDAGLFSSLHQIEPWKSGPSRAASSGRRNSAGFSPPMP
jgi:hypothetical protein